MLKIAVPCWIATTRRVVKLRPSRMRSTSKTIGTLRVAELEEVRVHRVHPAVGVDRAARGHERLREHLAAEDPLAVAVEALTPEQVDLERLEVEQVDEIVERVTVPAHRRHDCGPLLARTTRRS